MRLLITQVMQLGTTEDAQALLEDVGREQFIAVLYDHPVGLISDRSLSLWHSRLGLTGVPPKMKRRIDTIINAMTDEERDKLITTLTESGLLKDIDLSNMSRDDLNLILSKVQHSEPWHNHQNT